MANSQKIEEVALKVLRSEAFGQGTGTVAGVEGMRLAGRGTAAVTGKVAGRVLPSFEDAGENFKAAAGTAGGLTVDPK